LRTAFSIRRPRPASFDLRALASRLECVREGYLERRPPPASLALHTDFSAMKLDELTDNREAESHSRGPTRTPALPVAIEDEGEVLGIDALTVVAHREDDSSG